MQTFTISLKIAFITLVIYFLCSQGLVHSYYVRAGGNNIIPSNISSVLGEPRKQYPPQSGAGVPYRFHQGVDIPLVENTSVQPIENGQIIFVGGESVRVQSTSGRIFEYIHVEPLTTLNVNDEVTTNSTIATIQCLPGGADCSDSHLHLQEISGTLCVNPLRSGGLEYTDSDTPVFIGSTGIGTESVSVIR